MFTCSLNRLVITIFIFLVNCTPREKSNVDSKASLPNEITRHDNGNMLQQESDSVAATVLATCLYDNDVSSLGIGLVIASSTFVIFDDSTLKQPFGNFDLYDENTGALCSKFFKPDYGIMHFVCLDSSEIAYKVLTDHTTIKYLPRNTGHTFITWSDYILQSHGIRRQQDSSQPLRKEPLNNSEALIIPSGFEMFCPIEIQGDWVKVTFDCFYNQENNPHEGRACYDFIHECNAPLTGWIKWKENTDILIDILLMA